MIIKTEKVPKMFFLKTMNMILVDQQAPERQLVTARTPFARVGTEASQTVKCFLKENSRY